MPDNTTIDQVVSSDIYQISDFVYNIMKKHIELEDEDTQYMSIYGYLNEIHTLLLQNQIVMSAELAAEAIPTMAKYDKNIITHAASMGVGDINARPAIYNTAMLLLESEVIANMNNNTFVYDATCPIYIGDYEFHPDYDIIISQSTLSNGETVYTARYDMTINNPISDITDPYLNPPTKVNMNGEDYLLLNLGLKQTEITTTEDKVMTSTAIESKMFTFEFEGQLADFSIDVVEGDNSYHLVPYYEGTVVRNSDDLYCYYCYLDAKTIRVKFVEESYYPKINCDVNINITTTKGVESNRKFTDDIEMEIESDRFNYNGVHARFQSLDGEIRDGEDKKTIDDLKKIIPKEALSRGSITNLTDLNNYFSLLDDGNRTSMFFYRKRDNQLERLYYAYLILKDNDYNIIPTNTSPLQIYISDFVSDSDVKYVINPGTPIAVYPGSSYGVIIDSRKTDLATLPEGTFLYTTPFMVVVNSKPLSISYYMNIINKRYNIEFGYINQGSVLQFITGTVTMRRPFSYDRNTYTMSITVAQNIHTDQGLLVRDETTNEIVDKNIRVVALIYNTDEGPYRWMEGELVGYDEENFAFTFDFTCTTNDIIDETNKIRIEGMNDIRSEDSSYGYFYANCKCEIYVLVKQEEDYGRDNLDGVIPNLQGWTLCNRYDVQGGIDFFLNYSHIVSSAITAVLEAKDELLPDRLDNTYLIKQEVLPNSVIDIRDVKGESCDTAYFGYGTVDFNMDTDKMIVFLDGVRLTEDVDYTIDIITKNIRAVDPEGWILDEGMERMIFQFLIFKNGIASYDDTVRYKLDVTTNGISITESTDTVSFIGDTLISFSYDADTLIVYVNGIKQTEGIDYSIDYVHNTITNLDGEWVCDEKEPIMYFDFARIRNNRNFETDESTAIVVGDIGDSSFRVSSVPLVKYDYIVGNETNASSLIKQLELRKEYIDIGIDRLENQFGIDFKLVNTYGPSKAFYISDGVLINKVNLEMNFRMSPVSANDKNLVTNIADDIKTIIEDINSIEDLHIPNLITTITTKYREQLIYFEFLGFNGYGPGYQHIYQNEDMMYGTVVPEFLNIDTSTGTPAINITVV